MPKETINFKPKQISKSLLSVLSERAAKVLEKRYGLDASAERQTLEAIGEEYDITRERVRQIENSALAAIKKSEAFAKITPVLEELKTLVEKHGGVVHEQEFLDVVATDESAKNNIHFLLVLGDAFVKLKEDDKFHHRWTTDAALADKIHKSLEKVCRNLSHGDLITEEALVASFIAELKNTIGEDMATEEVARKWLTISKNIGRNPLGEWGLSKSPNIKMRGIRDYAYLVLRKRGSPMHFTEVAKVITETFGKKAHAATCHNELIKDSRFVLVGRGLYALAEWGYSRGVVRDVIRGILKKEGPLTREEIIQRVLKERYVKENTILVNLQNPKYFKKDKQGRYTAV